MAVSLRSEPQFVTLQRYDGLDTLRACLMLLGIVFHLSLPYTGLLSPGYFVTSERSVILQLFLVVHYFRMPAFYLLSGFFSALLFERRGWKEFLRVRWKRVGRIWIAGVALLYPITCVVSVYNWQANSSGHAMDATLKAIFSLTFDRNRLPAASLHLWFLEYLMIYCVIAGVVLAAFQKFLPRVDRVTAIVLGSKYRVFLLAAPTAVTVITMPLAFVPYPASLIPWLGVWLAYGWFFVVGWLLCRCRESLPFWNRTVALEKWAIPVSYLLTSFLIQRRLGVPPGAATPVLDIVVAASTAVFMWSTVTLLTVVFLRTRRRAWLSYLADASYWLYLAHFPLALLMPAVLRYWGAWPVAKVAFAAVAITAILLVPYQLFIRYGAIGRALNGPRERRNAKLAGQLSS